MGFNNILTWLKSFGQSVLDGFLDIGNLIDDLMVSVGDWFSDLSSSLTKWFNGIYQNFLDLSNSIGGWFSNLTSDIGNWFTSVGQWFAELPQKLVDAFKDLFEFLFVPDGDPFTEIINKIKSKFPIVDQLKELSAVLLGFDYGSEPVFTITYNGQEYPLIDLTPFNEYKKFIHAIIIAICYFAFVMRLIKRMPYIIGGF